MFPETFVTLISTFEKSWFCANVPMLRSNPRLKQPAMCKAHAARRILLIPVSLNTVEFATLIPILGRSEPEVVSQHTLSIHPYCDFEDKVSSDY